MSDTNNELPRHMTWRTHNGDRYLYTNYRNLPQDEVHQLVQSACDYVISQSDPELLQLIDVYGTEATKSTIESFMMASKTTKGHFKKVAVIGVSKLKVMIISSIRKFVKIDAHPFTQESDALTWLFKETD